MCDVGVQGSVRAAACALLQKNFVGAKKSPDYSRRSKGQSDVGHGHVFVTMLLWHSSDVMTSHAYQVAF